MSFALSRLVFVGAIVVASSGASIALGACSSTADAPVDEATEAGDGGTDAQRDAGQPGESDAELGDGGQCGTKVAPQTGETCVGFGTGAPCGDPACGTPAYGYVCFNGGPPGLAGCVQTTSSSFGETYCCPELRCVAQPDQDTACSATPATPHRRQCPPDGDGGNVAPPAGCVDGGAGGSALENFFCCP